MTEPGSQTTDLNIDPADLYREETFTDRRAGTIRRMVPVTSDGTPDDTRPILYIGQAQLMTPVGAMPISFEIDAQSLTEAIERFPAVLRQAVDRTIKEAEELRREAASSIVVPEAGMGGPGGLPGGGKIKIP